MFVINGRFLLARQTGVQRFARKLTELLAINNPDCIVVLPETNMDFNFPVVKVGKLKGHAWEQIELPNYLRSQGNPLLVNLASTAPIKYKNQIVTVHDITYIRYPESFSKSFTYFYKFLVPRILKNSRHIVTVSNFSKEEISGYFGVNRKKISVIYNAADDLFISEGNKADLGCRYILTVSSPNYHKNFLRLVEAYCEIEEPGKKLVIVGSQDSKVFSGTHRTQSENIIYTGSVTDDELAEIYRGADLFIFPSLYEGFGIPPIEAQKSGIPVISSHSASLPEVLQESALYIDPYSKESIIKAIEKLGDNNLRNYLTEKGLKNSQRFNWLDSSKNLEKIINNYK